jgi:hypothetical protein
MFWLGSQRCGNSAGCRYSAQTLCPASNGSDQQIPKRLNPCARIRVSLVPSQSPSPGAILPATHTPARDAPPCRFQQCSKPSVTSSTNGRQHRELGARISGDVHDESPGPCPSCQHAARCGSRGLACEAYALFVKHGGSLRWSKAPRQPSAVIFARLFRECDDKQIAA